MASKTPAVGGRITLKGGAAGINMQPFVTFSGPTQTDAIGSDGEDTLQVNYGTESALAGHIRYHWQRNKLFKEKIQLELLRDLRARRGVYSAAQMQQMQANGNRNYVWVDITETKCRAGSAWVREVLMPVGDRAWQLTPSPLPELPAEFTKMITEKAAAKARDVMQQSYQAGVKPPSLEEFHQMTWEIAGQIKDEVMDRAKNAASDAAERMEKQIEEDMDLGSWDVALDGCIEDFLTFKACFMIGPVYKQVSTMKWLPGFKVSVEKKPRKTWERLDPFDAFPAPYGETCQVGDFIARRRFRRDQLYDLIGVEGYNEPAIRQVLEHYSNGHLEAWLWTEAERQRLQQETMYTFLSPWGIIDALWYWGSVPGWKLMEWGMLDVADPVREYEVEAMLVGKYVIMCRLNPDPLKRRPFWNASYDKIPGALWGRSVPELAETSQRMCNAAACAMADNLGFASGVMLWVHNDRLAEGEDPTDIYPWRMFQLKSDSSQGVNPGIGVLQIPDMSANLQALVEKWDQRSDDVTGIPRYTYGNEQVGGAADTYAGLSMLMNNAAKGLRRAIASIDLGIIQPSLQMTYEYEMIYGDNLAAKGDCYIEARGAAAILVKEAMRQAYQQILQASANPMDQPIFGVTGRAEVWRHVLKGSNIPTDNIIPPDETLRKDQQDQQQQMLAAQQTQFQNMAQQHQGDQQFQMQLQQQKLDAEERMHGAKIGADVEKERIKHAQPDGIEFDHDEQGNIKSARPVKGKNTQPTEKTGIQT
jgi:hypothetical protein